VINMRRLIMVAVLACMHSVSAAAKESGALQVATRGPLGGFDLELLAVFGKAHGHPIRPLQGDGTTPDVISGVLDEAVDTTELAVTREVFPTRLVAVTARPQARIAAIETLRGRRIGVLRGSRAGTAVHDAKISGARLSEYTSLAAATEGLGSGELDAVLVELPEALLAQQANRRIELGVFLGARRSYVFAVPKAEGSVLRDLNEFLEGFRRTASWTAVVERHYGPRALEALARARLDE
jgi:ABC-type amino acid transport substrate-binding protein